jgi:hypothetical protein
MGSSATLAVTNSSASAIAAYGTNEEVIGNLQRAVSTVGTYLMNNDSTRVSFAGGAPSTSFTLRVDSSLNPSPYSASKDVNRKVTVSYAGWTSGYATLKLGYRYTERQYVANESNLQMFKSDGSSAYRITNSYTASRASATSSNFGSLTLAGIYPTASSTYAADSTLQSGSQILLEALSTVYLAIVTGDWSNTAIWSGSPSTPPGASDAVQIPNGFTVTTTGATTALSVVVDNGGALQLNSGLTINSSLTNSGAITIPSGQTLQVAAAGSGVLQNNSNGTITNSGTIQIGN